MNRVNLVVLWHMHQPQYRDPETGQYVLPWTRLHALKDYCGMLKVLGEVPGFHATFNVVPALGMQLEEYAIGEFNEPWFTLAFKPSDELTREDKTEILARAFQLNHERLMSRWPRFVELFEWSRPAGGAQAQVTFTARDWRDLQVLSQLAWMDEIWLAKDEVVSRVASKGKDYTERDKSALKAKQLEFLGLVLPAYREAVQRGQIEISTTPFYHPILPLLCDSDIARVANPGTPLPPAYGLRKAPFPIRPSRSPWRRDFSGSAPMKVFLGAASTLDFSATLQVCLPIPNASTNRTACNWLKVRSLGYSAIIICRT
jgi:alpha-amylase/alpha-mannosidase (GH57 family)